MLLVENIEEKI